MVHILTHQMLTSMVADSFTYKVNDGTADSGIQTISITVNPVNDAPVALRWINYH